MSRAAQPSRGTGEDGPARAAVRSPGVSALVVTSVALACGLLGWSCIGFEHVDPFARLPVRMGGWALLGWSAVVLAVGLTAIGRVHRAPAEAYVRALLCVVWLVVPGILLLLVRVTT